jgi:hypothetical protein
MPSKNRIVFDIAGIPIGMELPYALPSEEAFRPFLTEKEPQYLAVFRQVETLPSFSETVLWESDCYRVHPDGKGGFLRSFFQVPQGHEPYGVGAYGYEGGSITVSYLERGRSCLCELSNSFFHIGFEALMLREKRMCLHASCIKTALGGILFSGRSGIGKSTQAALWQTYRGAELINGDRPILSREADGWLTWGSPYAGSSRCYVNASCPVRAVVMLQKSADCHLSRLSAAEAFRRIYAGLTVYRWDAAFVTDILELVEALVREIPVFEYACTPDERSVEVLERALREEGL